MVIIAECDIDSFFQHSRELTNNPARGVGFLILKKRVSDLANLSEFFYDLELSFDNSRVEVIHYNNKSFKDVKGAQILHENQT
jgi:hypothetical protein